MKDVNGTRYIITALSSNLITAKKLGANDDEPLLLIPQVIHLTKNDEFPFIMKWLQFPVKLAYVMTFQRAQGQSLENAEFFLIEVFGCMANSMLLCQDVALCHGSKCIQIRKNSNNSISHQTFIICEMFCIQKFST